MPRIHTLDCELIAPGSLAEVFHFFEDPANLARITPSDMGFEIVSTDRNMRRGLEIEYRVKVMGLKLPWKSLISEYGPPDMFVDEALVSPYKLWRHRHTFRETPKGILVSDHVDYELPLYPLGEIAHPMVKRQLMGIFSFRQKALAKYLGKVVEVNPPVIR
jgi:ligand-binding SRPBCC domain-containing protein